MRSRSLRSILWFGVAIALLVGVGTFALVVHRIVELGDQRSETRARYGRAEVAHQARLAAVFEADGADPESARQDELDAEAELTGALDADDRVALDQPLRHLDDVIRGWRDRDATDRGVALSALRDAHREVDDLLHQRAADAYGARSDAMRDTVVIGGVALAIATLFAIVLVVVTARRTAGPLERLSRMASNGESFPPPAGSVGVQEVDTLAWALHELDLAVRDREERLAAAHAEAVELGRFGEHVQQLVDEAELHDALGQRLLAVSDAHAVTTMVHTAAGRLEIKRSSRDDPRHLHLPILDEPARCRAVRTLKPVHDDGGSPTACRCALAPENGSYLCAPMLAAGEVVGVVNLQADWKGHFTSRSLERVHASLGFGATALASLRLLAATRDRALRDPLTGAFNRNFLNEYLNKHLALAERRGEGLGVLAVDLDHFKKLNDSFGHAAGDRALVATVAAIQAEVRASDAVVRHGGEELIVVLVDTDLRTATEIAERIRLAIEAIDLRTEEGRAPVRASIGVAAFPGHGRDQATLLGAADRALYRAKEAGRNRVIAADRRDEPSIEAN